MKISWSLPLLVALQLWVVSCGAKTILDSTFEENSKIDPSPEICDGIDNDLDGQVDEPWLDEIGRYVHSENCGSCQNVCVIEDPNALAVDCRVVDEIPLCVATECEDGYSPTRTGQCVPLVGTLCLPCINDQDCEGVIGARCHAAEEENICVTPCTADGGCPAGYVCDNDECFPAHGSCWCEPGLGDFVVACSFESGDESCIGTSSCSSGILSECFPYAEICDGLDNDCNGEVDEPYRDELGAYTGIHNCGRCGVDCTLSPLPEGELTCGGDPFLPSCVLLCSDTLDGLDTGDQIDADLIYENGCECTFGSLLDIPGPIGAEGDELDVNCDGADGIVRESVYVVPNGDDGNNGSPLEPVRTITSAIALAVASLETENPRPHIFIASGTYGEVLHVPEGIQIHGGYRRDFRAHDPNAYQTVIYSPGSHASPGGSALVIGGVKTKETVVEGLILHGASAGELNSAAYGAVLVDSESSLILRNLVIFSGHGAAGFHGIDGDSGLGPTNDAGDGELPRAATERRDHICVSSVVANQVSGGVGGTNICNGVNVSGGNGGTASCPHFDYEQPDGERGRSEKGGLGGGGGTDSRGPISGGPGCGQSICCGLADFTVPNDMTYAADGQSGISGTSGSVGRGCDDSIGSFNSINWIGNEASSGSQGSPGGGGGGGGAGGGAEMDWIQTVCEFADGLGGGGGGGGAGGCGGAGGLPGTSGGPSIGILMTYTSLSTHRDPPYLENVTIFSGDGGIGGRGGAGGDGGPSGNGGAGGNLPRELRTNPSLAGPTPGAHGGKGGDGGPGGGGGGGCGGSSIGVLLTLNGAESSRSNVASEYEQECDVTLGSSGTGGRGGGGAQSGGQGLDGVADAILVY